MVLHSKIKGSIGELAVAKKLMEMGYSVFKELGDNSRVDLICLIEKVPIKIQVKSVIEKNNIVAIKTTKNGPNYSFRYETNDVDCFAIYVLNHDIIFFVSSKEFLVNKMCNTFRLAETKNRQKEYIRMARDYYSFERILRDYTPSILPSNVEDNDIVQTTTQICG